MGRFQIELAGEQDDAELREIIAATPMPGTISLCYRREPSYFAGAVVYGPFHQVVVVRDRELNQIVGFGSRSIRACFVNGRPQAIGYLCNLRGRQEYWGSGLLARGFAFIRQLHQDGQTRLYLTTIAEGNDPAIQALTSRRAGLPGYHFAGLYHALAIPARRRSRVLPPAGNLAVRAACHEDLPNVLSFLEDHGPRRQFFPCYTAGDFFSPKSTFRDLKPSDLALATRGERIVGTMAGWDQSGFRQSVVEDYSGLLRCARPVYNCWARWQGLPRLPRRGEVVRYLMAALAVVAEDDPAVFATLVEFQRARAAAAGFEYLLVGLHESDPLFQAVTRVKARRYTGRLYLVCWDDGEELRRGLDRRPVYLEPGTL